MSATGSTIRLTTAQAIVRFLAAQMIETDNGIERFCGGGLGIFGHGNVTCLGEALHEYRDELPLWRGQNEQSMAMAAIAYAKQKLRRRFMFSTASAGPGTTNMLTSAAIAHANRLPFLMLCGDYFVTRLPDPVLQQVEHFEQPSHSVTDAFKSVTRYWDRIMHPAQVLQSLPAAIGTLLDPADCGPVFIALPQDVQGWSYDYPAVFFEERIHRIRRPVPDPREIADAARLIRQASRPVIVAGGGVQYASATDRLAELSRTCRIPVVETIAGRANMLADEPLNCGPIGSTGSNSANNLVARADLIMAVGTRLQDFTTGSWTAFAADARILSINVCRQDASKHLATQVVGDAGVALEQIAAAIEGYQVPHDWVENAVAERSTWHDYVRNLTAYDKGQGNRLPSYAQVIGAVNELCDPSDRIVSAAGGLPAEITANWKTRSIGSVDVEFGFSCMGYEIAGGWGARIAQHETTPELDTIVLVGDGSYMLLNSDIYSSVLSGRKLIVIVCDNGGFAVINKLQRNTGNAPFNNMIRDTRLGAEPFSVDFAMHARAMGAVTETVTGMEDFAQAFARAKASDRTYVIAMQVDPNAWTEEGHAWWEVGTPEVSKRPEVLKAHKEQEVGRARQRAGV